MRSRSSWSAVVATAVAMVAGLLSAAPVAAEEPSAVPVAQVPVRDAGSGARASGLVVTTSRSSTSIEAAASDVVDDAGAEVVRVASGPAGTRVVSFDEPVSADVADGLAAALEAQPGVGDVEPDYVRSAADAPPVSVNDPLFARQKNLWDTSRAGGGYSTRAPAFWQASRGTSSVRVAVLDTGRTDHPDLLWSDGYDAVGRDTDPTDPGDFHGTHVAGIVAAQADNGRGVAGVAPGVSLVPVRVLDASGSGSDSTIARGILWAAGATQSGVPTNPSPAQVITMSLAGPGRCTSTLSNAIGFARSRGIVVVAAAGNDGKDASGYSPASCPGVIGVGATDDAGARASFSNTGAAVDISAPGVRVLSTYTQASSTAPYGYAYLSGTSMAAPAVAGAAALLASVGMTGAQIEAALPTMVQPATSAGTAGVLDLGRAPVAAVQSRPAARVPTTVSAKLTASSVRTGKRSTVRVTLRARSGARPTGRIRVFDGSRLVRTATVSARRNGRITIRTPRLRRSGVHRIRVVYLGQGSFAPSRSVVRKVRVR